MSIEQFELAAVQTAMSEMLRQSYFDICAVRNCCQVLGVKPDGRVMDALQLLHCVHYSRMSPEILAALPDMLAQAFRGPRFDVSRINFTTKEGRLLAVKHE